MARRGRPSRKTMRKRKKAAKQSKVYLFFAFLIIIGLIIIGYFSMIKS